MKKISDNVRGIFWTHIVVYVDIARRSFATGVKQGCDGKNNIY